jgi:hypothetical protein
MNERSKPTKFLGEAVIAMATVLSSCTTFVEPTTCERVPAVPPGEPQRRTTACGGIHDARFCDYVAVAVEGTDCNTLGIIESKHFCVVTPGACIDTHYSVQGRDCKIVRYEKISDSTFSEGCPTETPFFVGR